MTQAEMDNERVKKEQAGIAFSDVKTLGSITVRIFADGFGYALTGMGGRYVKYFGTGVWDYDAPGSELPFSHADKKYEQQNKLFTSAWEALQ